jgi:hypothetical protein
MRARRGFLSRSSAVGASVEQHVPLLAHVSLDRLVHGSTVMPGTSRIVESRRRLGVDGVSLPASAAVEKLRDVERRPEDRLAIAESALVSPTPAEATMPAESNAVLASSRASASGGGALNPSTRICPSSVRIDAMSAASRAPGFGATLP